MLFVALSSLQGRPMGSAFRDLQALGVEGVQLTPGNMPTEGFSSEVQSSALRTRTHHGFTWRAFRTREVWSAAGDCLVDSDSVHAPLSNTPAALTFLERLRPGLVLETMYPSYVLGDGASLEQAMAARVPLAVDVSHLFIQKTQGVLSDATLARLLDYEHVAEVHVSANDGRRDLHAPLTAKTFGLEWAHERERAGVPVVLECYFHRLPRDERLRQLELARA